MPSGYYRFPTIHDDTVVFVCEDDLWTVPAEGGIARRLTSSLGEVTRPCLSPDGSLLAFTGKEEGMPEVYLMPALGGAARRITYTGASVCQTVGWRDGKVLVAHNAGQPFTSMLMLYAVDPGTLASEALNLGPARNVAFGPQGGVVIGRNTADPARWKRYRGGTAGQLWIDEQGAGDFHPLVQLDGNIAAPMWLPDPHSAAGRIFFLSDHEGTGNLYSCLPSGQELRRHTDHEDYYARNPSSDGSRIVYHAGADLFVFEPASGESRAIPVAFYSPQTQRNRKFVDPAQYLGGYNLHPHGQAVTVATRGKIFGFSNWEGPVFQYGSDTPQLGIGVRYRLPTFIGDGRKVLAVTDEGGEERFIIFNADGSGEPERLPDLDIGHPEAIAANPFKDMIAFSNHRYELICLDLQTKELRTVDRGLTGLIAGFQWSPDGEWLAYGLPISLASSVIKLWKLESGESHPVTRPLLRDFSPAFDPGGQYLYFLSARTLNPVYDSLQFDLGFPLGMRPYLVTLHKDAPNPFILQSRLEREEEDAEKDAEKKEDSAAADDAQAGETEDAAAAETKSEPNGKQDPEGEKSPDDKESDADKKPPKMEIDLERIEDRVLAFPIKEGIFGQILGLREGKVAYTRFMPEGALEQRWNDPNPPSKGALFVYTLSEQREEMIVHSLSDFSVSRSAAYLTYRSGRRLRVIKAGEKPNGADDDEPNRKSGWLDLYRIKVAVEPAAEWRQMFREAWRLQRDNFWTPDMSQIDWVNIHDRYLPLVDRVSTRSEFSDLMWEMQGELGTSHAYEVGGDYRPEPYFSLGNLGADLAWDDQAQAWVITHIVQGDSWDPRSSSPLLAPGVNLQVGDRVLAINGQALSGSFPPGAALINLANEEIKLTVQPKDETASRRVTITALANDAAARYREWVEGNRARVHVASDGRLGYVHIPDMSAYGYAEFHRGYLAEVVRDGLVVDVRYNGGGHVSALLLQKLARRRIGYDIARWSQIPEPYPPESVLGPMVALTNENAGSDGDIFSHGFKLMKLGPLLGKRTWGGVVGINARHRLIDNTITTQPEFSFWFSDVGWGVENYGTDPDIEVENRPQDYAAGVDPQLERAIQECLRLLEEQPPQAPDFSARPSKAAPKLPPR